jgi:heterodisulfide reductase subunit A
MAEGQVLVVGGGMAGLTAALNLAQRGLGVTLVEREATLGGHATEVCCKAVQGVCQLCGGCLVPDRIRAAQEHPGITTLLQSSVTTVTPTADGFRVALRDAAGKAHTIAAAAILLATGFDHVDAHTKGPYAYGILPAVITGHDMELRLKREGQGAYDDLKGRRVAFVQCVGSRDEHAGRGYCSQVCCRYALRLARLLKARAPEVEITVFKMDMQTCGRDFAVTWASAQKEGIRFVAGLPAVIRRSVKDPQRATFLYDDILAGKLAEQEFDLVVLSVGMQPPRQAEELAATFGLARDRYGFFAVSEDATRTLVPGIVVAGTAQAPRSIAETVAHAHQAAAACAQYLQERRS